MTMLRDSRYFDPKLFSKIANLPLIARTVVEGMIAGRHQSPFHGFSQEFSEFRQYTQGDDPKRIDWKVAAKVDRIYIKTYQEETNLKAYLLIDVSGSMGFTEQTLTKLQYSCYCAAALAYLMIRQQDAVGLVSFDARLRSFMAPKSSPQQLVDILKILDGLHPSNETRASSAFHELAQRIKRRGLIIVFSDLLDDAEEVVRGLAHFRHKKHEVIVFHILDPAEIEFPYTDFIEFEDMETGQRMLVQSRLVAKDVRKKMNEHLECLRRRCRENSIEYVPVNISAPIERMLTQYLGKRTRMG